MEPDLRLICHVPNLLTDLLTRAKQSVHVTDLDHTAITVSHCHIIRHCQTLEVLDKTTL